MKKVATILALLVLVAGVATAQVVVPADQTGTICLAPIKDDGDPRGYVSKDFSIRVDNGRWVFVHSSAPQLISGLVPKGKHLVTIRDGVETIESFWFQFNKFESSNLCLWYKPWYRTWSLWDAAYGGQKCRCRIPEGKRVG